MRKMKIKNFLMLILLLAAQTVWSQTAVDTLLTLEQALSIALQNNHDIRIAENDLQKSKNNATPGNVGLFPSLSLQGNYNEELNNTNIEFASPQQPNISKDNARSTSYSGAVNFNYILFGGLGRFYRLKSLNNLSTIGNLRLRLTIENIMVQVHQAYFSIIQQAENVNIARMNLGISHERYLLRKKQFSVGGGGKLLVLNAEVDLNSDSIQLKQAQNNLENAKRNLNVILARNPEVPFQVLTEIPLPSVIQNEQALIRNAEEKNTELLLIRQQKTNAELQHKVVKAGYYPRINLSSSYNYNKTESDGSFITNQETYGLSGGLSLQFTIFDGRQQKIDAQNAEIEIRSMSRNVMKTEEQIKRDLLNQYNNLVTSRQLFEMARNDVETAELNFKQSEQFLQAGQISSTEYRTAQLNLMRALQRQSNYKIQLKLAEVRLRKVTGLLISE